MYKIVLIVLLSLMSVSADEVKWAKDFKSGVIKASKEKKPILFIISRDTCKYCILLEDTTLKDPKVIASLNKDFIAIRSWTNEGDYIPADLRRATPGLPGIWFLKSDGAPLYQPLLGYIDKEKMLYALDVVKEEFKKVNQKRVAK